MPPNSQIAREMARRLLEREAAERDVPDPAATAERLCRRMADDLSRWFGPAGCHALLTRAIARGRAEHPVLHGVRAGVGLEPCLDGLAESARVHGAGAAAEGVVAVLGALVELLGRLIGDDLAMNLVRQSASAGAPDDADPTREGELP